MKAIKWNPFEHEYSDYELPEGAADCLFDVDLWLTCASCGKKIRYEESLVSLEIHTWNGIGYAVCEECHGGEIARREAADTCMTRDELDAMTMGELKAFAKDIGCSLGYSAARKSSVIDDIMSYQRNLAMERFETAKTMPKGCR